MLKPLNGMDVLLKKFGGFFGWCRSKVIFVVKRMRITPELVISVYYQEYRQEFTYRLLYWKLKSYPVRTSQVLIVGKRRAYWSGFRSWSRGLHWDRRSRYGEK